MENTKDIFEKLGIYYERKALPLQRISKHLGSKKKFNFAKVKRNRKIAKKSRRINARRK